jgi:hypothetical protein
MNPFEKGRGPMRGDKMSFIKPHRHLLIGALFIKAFLKNIFFKGAQIYF